MNRLKMITVISIILFFSFVIFFSNVSSAYMSYYPAMGTYPYYFGTTSISNYGGFPIIFNNITKAQPYFGNTFLGPVYPALGDIGFVSSVKSIPGVPNMYQALQYYQYLSYAYQFYQMARVVPMFYLNDIVADYIGSSLYSYSIQNDLTPQNAIGSFIQQYLLNF